MNPGTLEASQKGKVAQEIKGKKGESKEDFYERLHRFEMTISRAKHEKMEFIEVPMDILNYIWPMGMNGGKYGIYKDVKLFPEGQAEKIMADEDVPIAVRLHGKAEGVLEGV